MAAVRVDGHVQLLDGVHVVLALQRHHPHLQRCRREGRPAAGGGRDFTSTLHISSAFGTRESCYVSKGEWRRQLMLERRELEARCVFGKHRRLAEWGATTAPRPKHGWRLLRRTATHSQETSGGLSRHGSSGERLHDVSTNGVHSMLDLVHQATHRSSSVCTPRSGT